MQFNDRTISGLWWEPDIWKEIEILEANSQIEMTYVM